jgi:hypothetical protein
VRQALGIAVHEAVEVNYRQKIETYEDLPVSDVQDAFATAWNRLEPEIEDPKDDPGEAKDSGVLVVEKYQEIVSPTVQPVFVEQDVAFELAGIPYSGIIDLVDHENRIRDLKVVAKKPSGRSDYALNMIGYALGYRTMGGVEEDLILDYMVRTKVPYYNPITNNGPITQSAINAFAGVLTSVSQAIKAGSFPPNGLSSGACSWCGYQEICEAYKVARE